MDSLHSQNDRINVSGVTFFGKVLGQADPIQMEKLDTGARAQLHFSRRFRGVSSEFIESLIGKEIEEFNSSGEPTGNIITLTQETIKKELGKDPFGFLPNIPKFSNPEEGLLTIKETAIKLASEGKLSWIEGTSSSGKIAKCYIEINLDHSIGNEVFVPLKELSFDDQEKATKNVKPVTWPHEGEGLVINGEEFVMPTLLIKDPIPTQCVCAVLSASISEDGKLTDPIKVVSAWPGRMQPSYPRPHMNPEELQESKDFFSAHARVVLKTD